MCKGLHKSFDDLEVLRGIDLEVDTHEVVGLIGASGSGKSTLIRCLNLLEPIDAGTIVIDGIDVTAPGVDKDAIRRRVGIVFQSFNLFPHMTVLANVTLAPVKVLGLSRRRGERTAPANCSRGSGSTTRPTNTRTGSRGDSSNAWRSCARSRCSPT